MSGELWILVVILGLSGLAALACKALDFGSEWLGEVIDEVQQKENSDD